MNVNPSKHYKYALILVGACGLIALLALLYAFYRKPPTPVTNISEQAAYLAADMEESNRALPTRLQVPKLGIDTSIVYLGLTAEGDMDAPSNLAEVGWYKYGALPGNEGTAVIAGHLNGPHETGAFADLAKLQPGDQVTVLDDKDQAAIFTVRETRTYDEGEQPNEVFNNNEGVHLNLITCAGAWDETAQRFQKRLVVFTSK